MPVRWDSQNYVLDVVAVIRLPSGSAGTAQLTQMLDAMVASVRDWRGHNLFVEVEWEHGYMARSTTTASIAAQN